MIISLMYFFANHFRPSEQNEQKMVQEVTYENEE